ncbi:alpha/beta hydrolase [Aliiruegeria lutimaris]|uniref:Esterase/lipase superfamily enzyme n=1 Tax=Aliiruegeria lutimaris TaxID=571298 RepID=A0A1G8NC46_9RHOB|nr:alpha/beta fold hydrolase [Aliiruegeria lutimaris]SDI77738.1 Esterase/lipase superfamily enzyme [Aliiruegeria lutimaris]
MYTSSPIRILVILALVLASCTGRSEIAPRTAPSGIGTDVEILVGSTRQRDESGAFGAASRGQIRFSSMEISIPPEHAEGKVEVGGKNPDPERHFLTRSIQPLSASEFRADIARRLAENPQYNGEVFIFIHGFNNTMADGVFRAAQIHSDLGINALPVHYAWPSSGSPLRYAYDRDSVLFARRGLETLIEEIAAAGGRNIVLLAHSLGSQVTMETLRQMSLRGRGKAWDRIGGVALMAPDLDIDLFHSQAADIGTLPQPFLILVSNRDGALRLSARLTGEKARLGNISSAADVSSLDVTVINVSEFGDARNTHLTAVSSPTLIALMSRTDRIEQAFRGDITTRPGLIPGTILTVQNATEIILDPARIHQEAGY